MDDSDDRRSIVSQLSETDRIVFSVLSNPERVEMAGLPRATSARAEEDEDDAPRIEEILPPIMEEMAAPAAAPPPPHFPPPPSPPPLPHHYQHSAAQANPSSSSSPPRPVEPPPSSPPPRPVEPPPSSPPAVDPEQEEMTKRTLLLDLRKLEMQGVKLSKEYTMDDRADDMLLEMRRHTLAMDEAANVNMMRDGLRILVTGIEMVNHRLGLLDLEGWSSEVCRDLHKHDANLGRIYRRYWRRSTSTSPELDICLSLAGSMGLHHMKRKMSQSIMAGATGGGQARGARRGGGGFRPRAPPPPAATPASSDDEGPPPAR
jgi:hypothetical protein